MDSTSVAPDATMIDFYKTGPSAVFCCLALFVAISLFRMRIKEAWMLWRKSNNLKTTLMTTLQPWILFRPFGDLSTVLALDSPSSSTLKARLAGFQALEKDLESLASFHQTDPRLVDCRFKKVKVLFPLLKELERKYPNRVEAVTDKGRRVLLKNPQGKEQEQLYLSCDAVRVLPEEEHDALMAEAAARYAQSATRSSTINLTPDLERHMQLLTALTGMQKFRYSLSGSECVDACLKDVRLSTEKKYIVRFRSAYHGHVSGVDSFSALGENHNFIYLDEMDEKSLLFIETYHYCIAGVIVNPMMFFTGVNAMSPPGEKMTIGARNRPPVTREQYAAWLHQLNEKTKYCTRYLTPMALILDDIYFAFRVPELFSFRYFVNEKNQPLDPDVVILGKGLAGGLPLSVICGKKQFSMNYDPDYLLKVNKVVGTLSAYPMGLIASTIFLERLLPAPLRVSSARQTSTTPPLLLNVDEPSTTGSDPEESSSKDESATVTALRERNKRFDQFTVSVNAKFEHKKLPLRLRNHANTFTVDFLNNSLYNGVYVQFLIANGVYVTNQSTGKFNLLADWAVTSDSQAEQALSELEAAFVTSGERMQAGGFFEVKRSMKWALIGRKFLGSFLKICYDQIMEDKRIDIEVSHNHPVNKWTHFWSSVGMILFAYTLIGFYGRYKEGMFVFLVTHVLRQAGHFFYEKQDRNFEKLKFGHKDGSKKEAVVGVAFALWFFFNKAAVFVYLNNFLGHSTVFVAAYRYIFLPLLVDILGYYGGSTSTSSFQQQVLVPLSEKPEKFAFFNLSDDQFVVIAGLMTIVPHFVEIWHEFGCIRATEWVLKILTDPFTDLIDFYEYWIIHPREFLDLKKQFGTYELDYETKNVRDCETGAVKFSRLGKLADKVA